MKPSVKTVRTVRGPGLATGRASSSSSCAGKWLRTVYGRFGRSYGRSSDGFYGRFLGAENEAFRFNSDGLGRFFSWKVK
jgi:hypothetical protein